MSEHAVGADKARVDTEWGERIFRYGTDEGPRALAILSSQGADLHVAARLEHVQHDDAVCDDTQLHGRQCAGDEGAGRTGSEENGVMLLDQTDRAVRNAFLFGRAYRELFKEGNLAGGGGPA